MKTDTCFRITAFAAATAFAAMNVCAAVTKTAWTGAGTDPTDLALGANWDGGTVPELNTAASPVDGPFAEFTNSNAELTFTMGRDLYLNGLRFNCNGSVLDFDITGRVLKLYGYTGEKDGSQFLFRTYNGKQNDILFRGGTFDLTGCYSDKYPTLYGNGPVAFSGTHFPYQTGFSVYGGSHLYMTNGVTGKVYFRIYGDADDRNVPKVTVSGNGTALDAGGVPFYVGDAASSGEGELRIIDGAVVTNAPLEVGSYGYGGYCLVSNASVFAKISGNRFFGMGINGFYSSNNVFEVKGGAYVYLEGEGSKSQLNVGHLACGNKMTVSGSDTVLRAVSTSGGVGSVTVGEFGDDNVLHITDGAEVIADMEGYIGNIAAGYLRGDSNRNLLLVDGGATYEVLNQAIASKVNSRDKLNLYNRLPDGSVEQGGEYEYSYCSNRLVVSGEGTTARIGKYMYVAGASTLTYSDRTEHNVFRVESNAVVSCALQLDAGIRGVSNGVEVAHGAALTVGKYGFNIGGSGSTGTYVRVSDAASVAVTHTADSNGIFSMNGSGPGGETTLEISGESEVSARSLAFSGVGNVVRMENGSLSSALALTCPADDASAVSFLISGTNSQLSVVSKAMTFAAGTEFSFDVPTGGFVRAPFAAQSIVFTCVPAVSFKGLEETALDGGAKMTLFESSTALTADETVVAAFETAAKAVYSECTVTLVDGKRIVLRVPDKSGLVITVR